MKIFKSAAGPGRLVISILFVSLVSLILTGGSQPARALTAYFFGPAWDGTECASAFFPPNNCVAGADSGIASFDGVADDYSGWIYVPDTWSLNASGITSLSTGDTLYSSQFLFSSGHVVVGVMQAQNVSSTVHRSIGTNSYGAYDYADTYDSGTGQWINNGYISYGSNNSTGAWLRVWTHSLIH